jgi:peroxiredoxin
MKKIALLVSFMMLVTAGLMAGESLKPGDAAMDFNLRDVSGKMFSLSQMKNTKGFIVVFTSITCPVSSKYEQRIINLNDRFAAKGYPVIAINSNDSNVSPGDSYENMQRVAREKGYTFEYLRDEDQEVAREYGATNTPHVYVLSWKNGKLMVEYVGAIDNNVDDPARADKKYVEDAVNALLKGEALTVSSTKAVGCSIKWKQG